MTEITIGAYELTAAHPASHYGIPVLVSRDTGEAFGPADPINTPATDRFFGPRIYPAAKLVAGVGSQATNDEDRRLATLFCRQWPEGPQVESVSR